MIDIEKLKLKAEACPSNDHLRLVEYHGIWYLRNEAGIVFTIHRNAGFPAYMAENEAYARLAEAASPAALLELIKKLKVALLQLDVQRAIAARRYKIRAELKAENERLRSAATTLIHLGYTDKGGEQWKPPLGKKPDFALIDSLRAENEKLKAQLAAEVMRGYAGAFYQMAEKLGITGARAESPKKVFEGEVMPALLDLIAERDRLSEENRALTEDPGSAL